MKKYAAIRAVSTYLPEAVETNANWEKKFTDKLGINTRHLSKKDEVSSDLCVKAAENLFDEYGVERHDIDYLVVCVLHPDYPMPPTSCIVQDKLKLKTSVAAVDIDMGCSGYVYGLSVVKGLVESGVAENVLFITTTVITKFINQKDNVMRPLFGDGATATLISKVESDKPLIHSFVFGTDGSRYDKLYIPAGGSKNVPTLTKDVLDIEADGNVHSNYEWHMDGSAISFFTLRTVPALVEDVLKKANLKREDIDYYIFHQANKFMMEHVQKKCHLEGMAFYNDISETGNTVAGSVPLGIDYVLREKNSDELKNVMLAGFGVGLSWAGCIADLTQMMKKR